MTVRLKGFALETRRRLRPVGRALAPVAAWVGTLLAWLRTLLGHAAPVIARGLYLLVGIPVAGVAILLELIETAAAWARRHVARIGSLVAGWLVRTVTPVRATAVVAAAAAAALLASQFVDYRGVAVGEGQYAGEVGAVAPVPLADRETAGSAHFYALGVLALPALLLVWATARGRWRLGRAVGLIGAIGIAVALLIDAPNGLDAGRAGISYFGTEARLIEGFWAQLSASAVLLLCGPLLGLYVKQAVGEERYQRRRARRRGSGSRREQAREGRRRGATQLRAGT